MGMNIEPAYESLNLSQAKPAMNLNSSPTDPEAYAEV